MSVFEFCAVLALGGGAYAAVELIWRGRTHWTMVLTGGVCFAFLYLIAQSGLPLPVQYAWGALVITALEFLVGAAVNVALGWAVWDYSREPMNLYGQICVRYTALWFLLSVPGCALARFLYGSVFHRPL